MAIVTLNAATNGVCKYNAKGGNVAVYVDPRWSHGPDKPNIKKGIEGIAVPIFAGEDCGARDCLGCCYLAYFGDDAPPGRHKR